MCPVSVFFFPEKKRFQTKKYEWSKQLIVFKTSYKVTTTILKIESYVESYFYIVDFDFHS